MTEEEFKVGDVVKIKSNAGMLMTVSHINTSSTIPIITCIWFDNTNNIKESKFMPDVLKFVKR